ncbi:meiotic cell cortex C-terminal pleckstrin homology-domain-containing protein [Spinellus fusiger]|nr:meiotic cell cortex C-terminal pleckstrin homology-domain-containing protein [Spinellus fusiger]
MDHIVVALSDHSAFSYSLEPTKRPSRSSLQQQNKMPLSVAQEIKLDVPVKTVAPKSITEGVARVNEESTAMMEESTLSSEQLTPTERYSISNNDPNKIISQMQSTENSSSTVTKSETPISVTMEENTLVDSVAVITQSLLPVQSHTNVVSVYTPADVSLTSHASFNDSIQIDSVMTEAISDSALVTSSIVQQEEEKELPQVVVSTYTADTDTSPHDQTEYTVSDISPLSRPLFSEESLKSTVSDIIPDLEDNEKAKHSTLSVEKSTSPSHNRRIPETRQPVLPTSQLVAERVQNIERLSQLLVSSVPELQSTVAKSLSELITSWEPEQQTAVVDTISQILTSQLKDIKDTPKTTSMLLTNVSSSSTTTVVSESKDESPIIYTPLETSPSVKTSVPHVILSPVAAPTGSLETAFIDEEGDTAHDINDYENPLSSTGTVDIIQPVYSPTSPTCVVNESSRPTTMDFGAFDLPSIGSFPVNTDASPTHIISESPMKEIDMISRNEADLLAEMRVVEALAKERARVALQQAEDQAAHTARLSVPPPPRPSPEPVVEKSMSTSRLARLSGLVRPQPSTSMPANHARSIKSSASMVSLRSETSRKESIFKRSTDSVESKSGPYGSVRIMEQRKYTPTSYLNRIDALHPTKRSQKIRSTVSLSTMSSDDIVEHGVSLPLEYSRTDTSGMSTDIDVISAITRTMIGEWMWKHTRRHVGGGISENKHKRFFWVHPYTRTLYWSATEPGVDNNEAKAKSAFIEAVSSVPSRDQTHCSPLSLLIKTTKRDLKLTAPTIELHELWLMSLSYLLARPDHRDEVSGLNEMGLEEGVHDSQLSLAGEDSEDSEDHVNIRSCCDGKHDLSTLKRGTHHH